MIQKYFIVLYTFCSVLGFVPFYSFKKSKLVKRNLNRVCLVVLLIYKALLITGYFLLGLPKFQQVYSLPTIRILEAPSHISYWVMPFSTVLILLVSTSKKWEEFLKKLIRLNQTLPTRYPKRKYVKHIVNVLLNIIMIFNTCSDQQNDGGYLFKTWYMMYSNFEEIYWLYLIIFINEIIHNLHDRYEALNIKLGEIIEKSVENKFMNKDVEFITVQQIRKVKVLYRNITELVELTNYLLGWPIFCLIGYTLLDTLSILDLLVVGEELISLGTDAMELFVILMYNLYVALSCDYTIHEGKKIVTLCYNLDENFPVKSPIREELLELAEQAKYFTPKFICVGLFEINRKLLLSMIATITTYVIVIVQFNNVLE